MLEERKKENAVKPEKTSKADASKAAKVLRDPNSSKKEKSEAGRTLARRATPKRIVKPAPKQGKLKKEVIRKAVRKLKKKK